MKIKRILKILIVTFVLFSVAYSQQIKTDYKKKLEPSKILPFTELTLELEVPTRALLQLQPISVVLKQRNRTNRPISGYDSIGFRGLPIYFYVEKADTLVRSQITKLDLLSGLTGIIHSEVQPGADIEAKEWIALNLSKHFSEPGIYKIQAVLANATRDQYIESNTITIEIREPTGTDRLAYNLIKNSSFQDYLYSGAEFDRTKITLEGLNALYPNSPYARSASFVLGETYFHDRQFARALTNLLRLENDKGFIFAEKVRKYLTEIRRINPNLQPEGEKP